MYIFKYALKSVSRSIGRNILIGIIVLIIAVSACVAMSIQHASNLASDEALRGMSISAHIYVDRQYVMNNISSEPGTQPDFREILSELKGLDLEEMKVYAEASSVNDFYYSSTLSMDSDLSALNEATQATEAVDEQETTAEETEATEATQEVPQGMPQPEQGMPQQGMPQPEQGMPQQEVSQDSAGMTSGPPDPEQMLNQMMYQGDFVLEGFVSDASMEKFQDNICYMTEGAMFEENTSAFECIITEELATYNSVSVGDTVVMRNPNNEEETYELTIVGIYKNTEVNTNISASAANDPANTIITSYSVIEAIETASAEVNEEENIKLTGNITGTYVFENIDSYDLFEKEVVELGLSEKYTVVSNDIATFEASMLPLQNLKTFATTFLSITLLIGAVVLIVISIISIRDRKYEIGAMAAMGLKKLKLSSMFMVESLIVVLIAIMLGSAIGTTVSVPIANTLLAAQVEQQISEDAEAQQNFGRAVSTPSSKPRGGDIEGEVEYVSSLEFSIDYTIVFKMVLIGIGLSVVSGFTSILFILRYDPKEILANRD